MNEQEMQAIKNTTDELLTRLEALGVEAAVVFLELPDDRVLRLMGNARTVARLTADGSSKAFDTVCETLDIDRVQLATDILGLSSTAVQAIDTVINKAHGQTSGPHRNYAPGSLLTEFTKRAKF